MLRKIKSLQGDLNHTARRASARPYVPAKMLADINTLKSDIAESKRVFEQHVKGCAPTSR